MNLREKLSWLLFALAMFMLGTVILGHCQQQVPNAPTFVPYENPQHATHSDLRTETPLVGGGGEIAARGERPVTDYLETHPWVPLGTVAREYREGHPVKREKVTVIP